MLSDDPIKQKVPSPKRRNTEINKKLAYSDVQKIEAVQTYLLVGSLKGASRVLNIPYQTIQYWQHTDWWKEVVNAIKTEENIILSNKFKKLIDKSLEEVEDRLDQGDWIYNQKTGQMVRKPVQLKDALKVTTDLMAKKALVEFPEQQRLADESIKEKLEKLAKSFEEFSSRKVDIPPVINVTDVVFGKEINALSEKRETGLQDGVQEVPQSPGTTPSTISEDIST